MWLKGNVGFGKGNDQIYVSKDADLYSDDCSGQTIYFGDGNNVFELADASGDRQSADVNWYGSVCFGSGKDSIIVGKYAEFNVEYVAFGNGIDTLQLGKNSHCEIWNGLDFGDESLFADSLYYNYDSDEGGRLELNLDSYADSDVVKLYKRKTLVDSWDSGYVEISQDAYNAGNYELQFYSQENPNTLAGKITFAI